MVTSFIRYTILVAIVLKSFNLESSNFPTIRGNIYTSI